MRIHEHKHFWLIIILIGIVLPIFLFILSPGFVGYDSYYFYNMICHASSSHIETPTIETFLPSLIFSALPCNELIIKVFLACIFIISLFAIHLFAENTKKGYGKIAILAALFNPLFISTFLRLENDSLALPFIFLSFTFLLTKKDYLSKFLGMALLGIGLFLWGGTVYAILGISLVQPIVLLLALPLLFLFFQKIIGNIIPYTDLNKITTESINGPMFFLFYGIWMFMYWLDNKKLDFPHLKMLLFTGILGILNAKFFILSIPFFALAFCHIFESYKPTQREGLVQFMIILVLFSSVGFLPIEYTKYPPKVYEIEAVQDLIQASNDYNKPIFNDFSLGHLVWFYGGKTGNHSGFGMGYPIETQEYVYLSRKEPEIECQLLKTYDWNLFGYPLRLWNC